MNPIVEQVAMALVALKDAQGHIQRASRSLGNEHLDMMTFDLERISSELVTVAQMVQSKQRKV